MCNSAVATAVRGATDVMTFGTAETFGMSKKFGDSTANIVSPPKPQTPAAPGSTPAYDPTIGAPQSTASTPLSDGATSAAAAANKRAKALQAGIMGTLGSGFGLGGTGTTKNAFATGMKTMTGQ